MLLISIPSFPWILSLDKSTAVGRAGHRSWPILWLSVLTKWKAHPLPLSTKYPKPAHCLTPIIHCHNSCLLFFTLYSRKHDLVLSSKLILSYPKMRPWEKYLRLWNGILWLALLTMNKESEHINSGSYCKLLQVFYSIWKPPFNESTS